MEQALLQMAHIDQGWPTEWSTEICHRRACCVSVWAHKKDRCQTVDDISVSVGLSHGAVHGIRKDRLKFRKVWAKLVPHHLTPEQEGCCMAMSLQALQHYNDDGDEFLSAIVTSDETWCHHFQSESKEQSLQ